MSETPSHRDRSVLALIARLRGIRAETLIRYAPFMGLSVDAARKLLERLCDQGFLAASPLPRGSRIFRLSSKGVASTGAPPAYASSPSAGIAAEMLAVSALAWRTEEYLFPTKAELEELLVRLVPSPEKPKLTGRFVLKLAVANTEDGGSASELHLHAFIAELRPADDLARRAGVVLDNLQRHEAFQDLIQARLLGVTIVVPSRGVRASFIAKPFKCETSLVVVEDLQDLLAH